MRIVKWLGGLIAVLVLVIVVVAFAARFSDGPIAIFPGGPLESGELHTGPEPDWTFARDVAELEFQLVEPPRSRTLWLEVVDGKLYVISAYMKSPIGKLWKKWPLEAEKDPRAVIRIDGKRYERKLVRLAPDDPVLEGIASEIQRKYGQPMTADMAATGDIWAYALEPR